MITLRALTLADRQAFEKVLNEPWENTFVFAHYFDSLGENDFEKYIEVLSQVAQGKLIPKEHVPSTLLFAFNHKGELVGRVSIRHTLNESLLQTGGHVGYGVAPSHRKKGYATAILAETLKLLPLQFPTLKQVLLTCDDSNLGSIKTIESNGGKLENIYKTPEMRVGKRRYWITAGF